jgi:autotransporter passenger strand-loop-strand repeat protein
VVSGGAEFVSGTADGTTAGPGSIQFVQGSGHANSTTVSGANAFQIVNSGGFASNGVVESGDQINVSAGGVASDTLVSSGGKEAVSSGGTLSSATIAGGTIEIVSGGTAGSSTITISSGKLVLDAAETFSGSIAGLATSGVQNIDLVDINFATLTLGYSGNTLSGVLSANDGVHTALLNMIGNYTPANFNTKAADDGPLITDPPLDAPAPSANLASLHSWGSDRRRLSPREDPGHGRSDHIRSCRPCRRAARHAFDRLAFGDCQQSHLHRALAQPIALRLGQAELLRRLRRVEAVPEQRHDAVELAEMGLPPVPAHHADSVQRHACLDRFRVVAEEAARFLEMDLEARAILRLVVTRLPHRHDDIEHVLAPAGRVQSIGRQAARAPSSSRDTPAGRATRRRTTPRPSSPTPIRCAASRPS